MNFPLVSKEYSFLPLSTPNMLTFPRWLPVAMYLESGEKATVQASTVIAKTYNHKPFNTNLEVTEEKKPK